jgi:hypothetical protein
VGVTVLPDMVAEQAVTLTTYTYDGKTITTIPPAGTLIVGVIVNV